MDSINRMTRGVFTLTILLVISTVMIQACDSLSVEKINSENDFFETIEQSSFKINKAKLNQPTKGINSKDIALGGTASLYISSEYGDVDNFDKFGSLSSIEEVVYAQNEHNLILTTDIQYLIDKNLTEMHKYTLPVEPIKTALEPSIESAKTYLKSKGFSDLEIIQMVTEAGGDELDLVPLVMHMLSFEKADSQFSSIPVFLVSNAYAQSTDDIIRCGSVAIGADILWALGTSDKDKWSKKAIKKAFKEVAKKALGPIGVAISVVTFSVCLVESTY